MLQCLFIHSFSLTHDYHLGLAARVRVRLRSARLARVKLRRSVACVGSLVCHWAQELCV